MKHVLELGAEAAFVAEQGDVGEEAGAEEGLEEGEGVGVSGEGGHFEEDFAVGEVLASLLFW